MRSTTRALTPLALALALLWPHVALAQGTRPSARPLTAEARSLLEAVPHENTPPPGEHYYRSNEWRQDLLRPHLEGLGGAFVGVGADQCYTMAAMQGAELLFLVDYDPGIPEIHLILGALVRSAETPAQLLARFAEENVAETRALLERELASQRRARQMVSLWARRRGAWLSYLERVHALVRDGRPFSWLADPALYAHIRRLFLDGRVIARNGDVTAGRTLRAVADASRRVGVPVRAVYFSNAEQFFEYTPDFVENMRQLQPSEGRAMVLRTIRHRDIAIAPDGQWHYVVHDLSDFVSRLETGAYRRSFALTADLVASGPPSLGAEGISTITADTRRATLEAARERRARREAGRTRTRRTRP